MEETAIEVHLGGVDLARMYRFLSLYKEAWARPTTGRLAELWATDAEMMHPEFEEPIRGRDAVMAYLRRFLDVAPDLTVRPLAAAANGDTLFIHFRSQATIAGEKLVWEGVDRYDLDGDQAVYGIGFFDTTALRRALAGKRL
jgi:predicted SnoaL-like aldol condensation-catalyzing enzyme